MSARAGHAFTEMSLVSHARTREVENKEEQHCGTQGLAKTTGNCHCEWPHSSWKNLQRPDQIHRSAKLALEITLTNERTGV